MQPSVRRFSSNSPLKYRPFKIASNFAAMNRQAPRQGMPPYPQLLQPSNASVQMASGNPMMLGRPGPPPPQTTVINGRPGTISSWNYPAIPQPMRGGGGGATMLQNAGSLINPMGSLPYSSNPVGLGGLMGATVAAVAASNLPRAPPPPPVLDHSEFPALGAATSSVSTVSQQDARTGTPASALHGGVGAHSGRPFTSDDFPALGVTVSGTTPKQAHGSLTSAQIPVPARRETVPPGSFAAVTAHDAGPMMTNGVHSPLRRRGISYDAPGSDASSALGGASVPISIKHVGRATSSNNVPPSSVASSSPRPGHMEKSYAKASVNGGDFAAGAYETASQPHPQLYPGTGSSEYAGQESMHVQHGFSPALSQHHTIAENMVYTSPNGQHSAYTQPRVMSYASASPFTTLHGGALSAQVSGMPPPGQGTINHLDQQPAPRMTLVHPSPGPYGGGDVPNSAGLTLPNVPQPQPPQPSQPPLPKPPAVGSAYQFRMLGMRDVLNELHSDQVALSRGAPVAVPSINLPWPLALASPWSEPLLSLVEPMGPYLPPSFSVPNVPPPQQKMGSFDDSTLFYIFYTMTRDVLQEAAAQELYNRNWRFHKEYQLWLTKDTSPAAASVEVQRTATHEQAQYVVWDVAAWKRLSQSMRIAYDALEERPTLINNGQGGSMISIPMAAAPGQNGGLQQQQMAQRGHFSSVPTQQQQRNLLGAFMR